ncbi:MAG TPA: glutaredoxin family protein [Anaerolineae bacterium]|nr:glutaredoxin family protein [Anaerolineae bacterium]
MPQLVLFTKPGCHLCEQVEALLRLLEKEFRFEWECRAITADPVLVERYQHAIPVIWLDGREVLRADVAPIDRAALRALLERAEP